MTAIPNTLPASKEVQLWVGPQHPGIPGNMAMQMWVEGDTIQRGITHVGYLHRAFEKLVERRTFYQTFPLVCRICVPEPDTNEYLLAAAVEELAGISDDIPERAQWIRTLVLEMSRLAALLMVVGGQAGGMGLGATPPWMIALRDYVLDLFEGMSGGRVYHMYIILGGGGTRFT
ncbi:MAG: NADH-quinone oxidoreductase subunit D, partial [Alphaproteobacteria bacterium]|nr:NADH-quinone oxidoreductase subunit D [Alphaproteobacteria bacterium]